MGTQTEKAVSFFTAVPRAGNCAQCVAKAFAGEKEVVMMTECGGGNAPDGLCGALHAAMILADEKDRNEIRESFRRETGGETCRELKQQLHVPCAKCVEVAAGLLEKKYKTNNS